MTTGENTDSPETKELENIIVTSDEVFERVSSNEKMIDEGESGYLKQNTAGLVQEIPNISFLDIADTMLESKKTFHGRENWVLKIGDAGKSIEAQPQDIGILSNVKTTTNTGLGIADFNDYTESSNTTCFELQGGHIYKINTPGIYKASFSFNISDINSNATSIQQYIMLNRGGTVQSINTQIFGNLTSLPTLGISNYGNSGSTHLVLQEGDQLLFVVKVADENLNGVTWKYLFAEFTLQFQQYTL